MQAEFLSNKTVGVRAGLDPQIGGERFQNKTRAQMQNASYSAAVEYSWEATCVLKVAHKFHKTFHSTMLGPIRVVEKNNTYLTGGCATNVTVELAVGDDQSSKTCSSQIYR
jgi:hypothetical protein